MTDTITPGELEPGDAVLNKDGTIRKKPGPKPGTPRKAKRTAPSPIARPQAAPRRSSAVDYRPAIMGLLQLPQVALSVAGRVAKDEKTKTALMLDGLTIGLHADNIAEALNTTAQTERGLAQILDKLATVGPWSLVITAVLAPAGQILANHGAIPPNETVGILPPEALAAMAAAKAGV